MLDYAIEHHLWPDASLLLSPLMRYWGIQVLHDEADVWLGKVRQASESAIGTRDPDNSAIDLWTTVVLEQLKWQTDHLQFDRAEQTAHELLAKLESLPSSPAAQSTTASAYQQLGDVAREQGHLDVAVNWYRKALDISVQIGDDELEMQTRLRLGQTAQEYRDHKAADGHYHRALAIAVAANDQPGIGAACHAFGYLYENLGQLDTAHEWYRKALAVHGRTGNRYQMANAAYQLGMIAHRREQLDVAETWYRQALGLYEDLDDKTQIACTYHELGMAAQSRGQLDIAENWYRKALVLGLELGNNRQLIATSLQLGLLAEQRGDDAGALDWTILGAARGTALFGEFRYPAEFPFTEGRRAFPHPMNSGALQRLVHLTDRLGDGILADRWRAVTASEVPEVVKSYLVHVRFMRNIEEGEAKYSKIRRPPPKKRKKKKKRRK